MYRSFEELEVWKRSCRLAVNVYDTLRECRDFGIRNQMQRSAISIASNIAEGSERGGRDFLRFLKIARGSCAELRTQMYIASRLHLIDAQQASEFVGELKELSKMMTGLAHSLEIRKTRLVSRSNHSADSHDLELNTEH